MTASPVEQLRLDLGPETLEPEEADGQGVDIIDTILTVHQGDHRKAIEALLLDADFLRDQLYTASCLISHGMGRGWRPRYERS